MCKICHFDKRIFKNLPTSLRSLTPPPPPLRLKNPGDATGELLSCKSCLLSVRNEKTPLPRKEGVCTNYFFFMCRVLQLLWKFHMRHFHWWCYIFRTEMTTLKVQHNGAKIIMSKFIDESRSCKKFRNRQGQWSFRNLFHPNIRHFVSEVCVKHLGKNFLLLNCLTRSNFWYHIGWYCKHVNSKYRHTKSYIRTMESENVIM